MLRSCSFKYSSSYMPDVFCMADLCICHCSSLRSSDIRICSKDMKAVNIWEIMLLYSRRPEKHPYSKTSQKSYSLLSLTKVEETSHHFIMKLIFITAAVIALATASPMAGSGGKTCSISPACGSRRAVCCDGDVVAEGTEVDNCIVCKAFCALRLARLVH